jgi:hypothetical protein
VQVGDLIRMRGGLPASGIVLRTKPDGINRGTTHTRVKIYWIEDGEVSWEPVKWLEVVSEGR